MYSVVLISVVIPKSVVYSVVVPMSVVGIMGSVTGYKMKYVTHPQIVWGKQGTVKNIKITI